MEFLVTVEPDEVDGGFVADCPQLPGCMSAGDTPQEALANIRGAIEAVLEARQEKGWAMPSLEVHRLQVALPEPAATR